uniref:Amino_oxidase domain-containing protein n=1 Tax=Heligmosomoides polygyrus TaxID=6339 RepID=A0A183G9N1_HELPZ
LKQCLQEMTPNQVMNKWFESDVLKATLGTDGVIGFAASPYDAGTGYVLLHHVIGGLDNRPGVWGYVMGGMGAVSEAIAKAARSHGAELYTDQVVDNGQAKGVRLACGKEIHATTVMSNTTPRVTFEKLLNKADLSSEFLDAVKSIDYTSPVTKINVAIRELPSFTCRPNSDNQPQPHHQTTIHMNCENMEIVHEGVQDFRNGFWSKRPVIEMTIPSVVDRSLVEGDESSHVVSLFTQYTPYQLKDGPWTEERKEAYARHVFNEIDCYAANFSSSIIGYEILPPPDIERIFGLTGGNIFHGSMSLDQLYFTRPTSRCSGFKTPIKGLFLCGSGSHPGGGVTGAAGRLGALTALER